MGHDLGATLHSIAKQSEEIGRRPGIAITALFIGTSLNYFLEKVFMFSENGVFALGDAGLGSLSELLQGERKKGEGPRT